mgnify:CR=1 FL=1
MCPGNRLMGKELDWKRRLEGERNRDWSGYRKGSGKGLKQAWNGTGRGNGVSLELAVRLVRE